MILFDYIFCPNFCHISNRRMFDRRYFNRVMKGKLSNIFHIKIQCFFRAYTKRGKIYFTGINAKSIFEKYNKYNFKQS